MPRPVTMPIANEKRRRAERTEAIRILKPAMSNIPKRVSATVAAHANDTVNELGKRDVTAPVYSTKLAKFPQDTFFDGDRKSTRLNSSHQIISYAVFCLKKKKEETGL